MPSAVTRAASSSNSACWRTADGSVSIRYNTVRSAAASMWAWRPGRYVDNDVAVLSIPLPAEDRSKRFKSVVHPSPKVWMHHLEVRDPDQVDDEVARWLGDAYDAAS
jgi:hypothetical protein